MPDAKPALTRFDRRCWAVAGIYVCRLRFWGAVFILFVYGVVMVGPLAPSSLLLGCLLGDAARSQIAGQLADARRRLLPAATIPIMLFPGSLACIWMTLIVILQSTVNGAAVLNFTALLLFAFCFPFGVARWQWSFWPWLIILLSGPSEQTFHVLVERCERYLAGDYPWVAVLLLAASAGCLVRFVRRQTRSEPGSAADHAPIPQQRSLFDHSRGAIREAERARSRIFIRQRWSTRVADWMFDGCLRRAAKSKRPELWLDLAGNSISTLLMFWATPWIIGMLFFMQITMFGGQRFELGLGMPLLMFGGGALALIAKASDTATASRPYLIRRQLMPNCRSQFVNSLFRSLMCEGAVGLGILLVVGVAAAAIFGKSSVESARNVAVSFATAMGLVISGIPLNLWLNSWGERFVELTATIVYAMMSAIAAYLFVDSGASSHWFAWIPFLSVPIALTVLFLRCARSEWMDFELERE